MSLKDEVKIDKFNLDTELVNTPSYLRHYGELHTKAVKAKEKQKIRLDVTKSKILADLFKNFKEYGFDKSPTAPQQEAFLNMSENYQKEQSKLLDKVEEVNYYNNALSALQAKRSALGNLVTLFTTSYWSDIPLSKAELNGPGEDFTERMNRRNRD